MRTTKTLIALLLTLALVMALAVTASADTPTDLSGHSLFAYQIFKGTQGVNNPNDPNNNNKDKLTNIEWGEGVDSAGLLNDLVGNATFPNSGLTAQSTAKDVAKYLSTIQDNTALAREFAKVVYKNLLPKTTQSPGRIAYSTTTTPPAGYYLIVDESAAPDAYNMAVLQMTGKNAFEVNVKTTVPSVEKKVKDKNDSTGDVSGWQDSADYDAGDPVPFKITVKVDGTQMKNFDTYTLRLKDKLDPGFTLINNAQYPMSLKVNGTAVSSPQDFDISYNTTIGSETYSFVILFKDIKWVASFDESLTDNTIELEYFATLNDSSATNPSVIGCNVTTHKGNDNEVYLDYSRNPLRPDYEYSVDTFGNRTYTEATGGAQLASAPKDVVRVFTYQFVVKKVDDSNQPLTGASFKLWKYDSASNTFVSLGEVPSANGNPTDTFQWDRIDDGYYKLEETVVPTGYNKLPDVYFQIAASHTGEGTQETLDSTITSLTCTQVDYNEQTHAFTATSNPTFQATATTVNDQNNVAQFTGELKSTVKNESGVVLPETGDEGTRMLYVVGTALLLGGLVLIVTKKRVGEQA